MEKSPWAIGLKAWLLYTQTQQYAPKCANIPEPDFYP